jgi:hypothetical protein
VRLEGLGQLKKIHLIGTRTSDLSACSINASTNYAKFSNEIGIVSINILQIGGVGMFTVICFYSVTVNVLQKTTKKLLIENETPELVKDISETM